MSDEPKKEAPTVIGTIWAAANWVVERELLNRIVMVAVLVALGAGGLSLAQDRFDGGIQKRVTPIEEHQVKTDAELATVKADLEAVKKQSANVERVVLTLDLNMRLMLESQKIKPIDVPKLEADGGR